MLNLKPLKTRGAGCFHVFIPEWDKFGPFHAQRQIEMRVRVTLRKNLSQIPGTRVSFRQEIFLDFPLRESQPSASIS